MPVSTAPTADLSSVERLLLDRIVALPDGEKLQPERELAEELGVGRTVLRGVLGQLEARGVITRQRRVGTIVNPGARQRLLPAVYLGRKDPAQMPAGSPRRLRNELSHRLNDERAAAARGYRIVPVPHEYDHLRVLATGRPTLAGVGGVHLPDAVAFGVCADLTERVERWPLAAEIWPNLWEAVTIDGRRWGVPSSAHVFMLVTGEDAWRRAGLPRGWQPGTWDEVRDTALRLQRDGGCRHGVGIAADHHLAWLFEDLCFQAGGRTIEQRGGHWRPLLNTPPVRDAAGWLQTLALTDGSLFQAADGTALVAAVARGDCGMALVEANCFFNEVTWQEIPPDRFEVGPLPAGPRGHRLCQVSVLVDFVNAGAPAEEQEAAWNWLTSARTPERIAEHARLLGKHRLVTGWPPIHRNLSHADTGVDLPAAWLHTVQDIVARARPQPAGHGWDLDIYLQPVLRRLLADAHADPCRELDIAQRLVRPGMRFLQ